MAAASETGPLSFLYRLACGWALTISKLAEPLALMLPLVMEHLDVLTEAGFICCNKAGRTVMVKITSKPLGVAMHWLDRHKHNQSVRMVPIVTYGERKDREAQE